MREPALRDELVLLEAQGRSERLEVIGEGPGRMAFVLPEDRRERFREILHQHGWPGRSLVGEDGARAAAFLAHESLVDPQIRADVLRLLEGAVARGDADAKDLAALTDFGRLVEGRPQVYGTLMGIEIEDATHVDDRRREVGLRPLGEAVALFTHPAGR